MIASLTERSRERVDDWIADFRAAYGEFERVRKEWEVSVDAYGRMCERFREDANGGGGVWVTDDAGRVLFVRNQGDEGWGDPGGKREAGESFEEGARREVREETGVTCSITDLLEVHVLEITDESDPDRPTLVSLIAIFGGEYERGDLDPPDSEIAEVGWFDEMPDAVLYPEVAERPIPASE